MSELRIIPVPGVPEVRPGDDLGGMIAEAATSAEAGLLDGDVLVVTQKVVSKAENQLVPVDPTDPDSHRPIAERESVRILRRRGIIPNANMRRPSEVIDRAYLGELDTLLAELGIDGIGAVWDPLA